MAEATTSRHDPNYIKIAMVVLRVSPRAVRVQFDKEFHPDILQRTLKSEWSRLSELQMKKRITQPQWNLLFPKTGRLLIPYRRKPKGTMVLGSVRLSVTFLSCPDFFFKSFDILT